MVWTASPSGRSRNPTVRTPIFDRPRTRANRRSAGLRTLRQLHLPGQRPLRASPRAANTTSASRSRATGLRTWHGGIAGRDHEVAPRLRPRPWRPEAAAPPEPDPGPDGAQRLHLGGPREAWPGRTDQCRSAQPDEDPRPRGDRARLRRVEALRRRALRRRGLGAGADLGPLHGGRAGPDHRQRGPGDRPRPLRAAAIRRRRA
jgi:hypothetical protein